MPQPEYPLIADHGLIGDLQSAALITTDGTIDWFCAPRFDSPSVFASLLDAKGGGRFRIGPEGDDHVVKQGYFPDSAILVTRFMSEDGVGELVDFMPVTPGGLATDRRRIVRAVRVVRGRMSFVLECDPRFDYGRQPHEVEVTEDGASFRTDDLTLTLHAYGLTPTRDKRGVRAVLELGEGEIAGVMLETGGSGKHRRPRPRDLRALFDETEGYWKRWLARSGYRGRWRDMVNRSAITLKLMIYEPTGAPVAAPTAGLPEQVGGERNWDYRYTWVRDGSFSVAALLDLGFTDEAAAFVRWIGARIRERAGNVEGPLQIMYRVDGSPDLDEYELGHMEGYRGSAPVRIGNGAADQVQLDIYGEMVDALARADEAGLELDHATWTGLAATIDWLCENWDGREAGIWETRGGPQEFVYGRLMAWVAFDRAIRLARARGRPADLAALDHRARRGLPADHGARLQPVAQGVRPALRLRRARRVAAQDAACRLRGPERPHVAVHPGRHGRGPGLGQPGLPLRPRGLTRRAAGQRGDVLDVHLLVRPGARALGPPAGRAHRLREDAQLRQPRRALLGGDRPHR